MNAQPFSLRLKMSSIRWEYGLGWFFWKGDSIGENALCYMINDYVQLQYGLLRYFSYTPAPISMHNFSWTPPPLSLKMCTPLSNLLLWYQHCFSVSNGVFSANYGLIRAKKGGGNKNLQALYFARVCVCMEYTVSMELHGYGQLLTDNMAHQIFVRNGFLTF